jgi:hypothetical protein
MSKTFPKNIDKKFDVSFSSAFLVLSRFRMFLSDWSSKHTKKRFAKSIVSKSFYKRLDQKSKTDFSRFFLSRFWAFLGEGSSKMRSKEYQKINLTSSLFRTLTHPPTTGVTDFLFCRALVHIGHHHHGHRVCPKCISRAHFSTDLGSIFWDTSWCRASLSQGLGLLAGQGLARAETGC